MGYGKGEQIMAINEKKIVSEIINHYLKWCDFGDKKVKEMTKRALHNYIQQDQYEGLFEIKINREVNLDDE